MRIKGLRNACLAKVSGPVPQCYSSFPSKERKDYPSPFGGIEGGIVSVCFTQSRAREWRISKCEVNQELRRKGLTFGQCAFRFFKGGAAPRRPSVLSWRVKKLETGCIVLSNSGS